MVCSAAVLARTFWFRAGSRRNCGECLDWYQMSWQAWEGLFLGLPSTKWVNTMELILSQFRRPEFWIQGVSGLGWFLLEALREKPTHASRPLVDLAISALLGLYTCYSSVCLHLHLAFFSVFSALLTGAFIIGFRARSASGITSFPDLQNKGMFTCTSASGLGHIFWGDITQPTAGTNKKYCTA